MARNKAKKGSLIAVPEPNQFDTASALIVDNPSSRNDSVEPLNGTNGGRLDRPSDKFRD
jgi:hypothetical protein